ncbi:MAG: protein-export chaperone SecB [Pontiellaceae bacterium]|nr:protein-export chaperone SecB [Pontiellaceae bacterium]MBN2783641.1 protein-export chaperone SecB [Pontiellaceae bacterium]
MSELKYQLERFLVESVAVRPNPGYSDTSPENTGTISVGVSLATHNEDKCKRQLILDINLQPKEGAEDRCFPYSISIIGMAFFLFHKDASEKDVERFLNINGSAMLFGLLRGQVSQITSQSVHGQFLLPPCNFVEMYEEKNNTPSTGSRKKAGRKG